VPGGPLNLNYTNLPRPWSPRESSPFRGNSHGGTGNRTRDLMISRQRLRQIDHEADHSGQNVEFWNNKSGGTYSDC